MAGHKDHLDTKSEITRYESILCGGIAGLVSRFVIAPLDVVKIRLQLQVGDFSSAGNARPGTVTLRTMYSIAKNEGIRSLWKGNVPAEWMYIFYGATQFTTYKYINTLCNQHRQSLYNSESAILFISGAGAGMTATFVTYPFDLLRTRFAAQIGKTKRQCSSSVLPYTSMIQAVRYIYKHEGFQGFFRGLAPAIYSIVPYTGIFFLSYEQSRRILHASPTLDVLPAPEATAGFVAGIISKGTVFPLDVIRKRLQIQGPNLSNFGQGTIPIYPNNVIKCAYQIMGQEGIRGLYKGFFVSLIKSAPSSAVTIWTFENSLRTLRYFTQNDEIDEI